MKKPGNAIGAFVLLGLAAIYLIASLALGRSATAEPPPDLALKAADAGIDVMKSVGATLDGATFVDVRGPAEFAAYHIPGSVQVAPDDVATRKGTVIVVASRDAEAQKIVGAARVANPQGRYFFLKSGVRDWYTTFELPVALFNEQPPPRDYDQTLRTVRQYVVTRDPAMRDRARMALFGLARMNYQPTLLASTSKSKPAAGARKKIAGGCGG